MTLQSTAIPLLVSDKVGPKVNFIFKIRKLVSGPDESWNSDGLTPQKCPHERMLTGKLYREGERMSGQGRP